MLKVTNAVLRLSPSTPKWEAAANGTCRGLKIHVAVQSPQSTDVVVFRRHIMLMLDMASLEATRRTIHVIAILQQHTQIIACTLPQVCRAIRESLF